MPIHHMQLPREVVVGHGTLELIDDVLKKLGFTNSVIIITGIRTYQIVSKKLIKIIESIVKDVTCFKANSTNLDDLEEVKRKISESKAQVVLGVGGGTKIDVAKYCSFKTRTPFISVPTTASHDGIASSLVSIKGLEKPYSLLTHAPMAIIADTELIVQAEHRFTASGCGDVLSKFTAVRDWELAHKVKNEYFGEYAASLALMSAKLIMKKSNLIKPRNEEGLRVVLEALISCGVAMSIAGSSRPGSGSEHLFSHALDFFAPKSALHGEQCGLGTILMAYLHGMDWKNIKKTLEEIGAPTTSEDLGVDPEIIVKALVQAHEIRPERYTILNVNKLTADKARKIARITGII